MESTISFYNHINECAETTSNQETKVLSCRFRLEPFGSKWLWRKSENECKYDKLVEQFNCYVNTIEYYGKDYVRENKIVQYTIKKLNEEFLPSVKKKGDNLKQLLGSWNQPSDQVETSFKSLEKYMANLEKYIKQLYPRGSIFLEYLPEEGDSNSCQYNKLAKAANNQIERIIDYLPHNEKNLAELQMIDYKKLGRTKLEAESRKMIDNLLEGAGKAYLNTQRKSGDIISENAKKSTEPHWVNLSRPTLDLTPKVIGKGWLGILQGQILQNILGTSQEQLLEQDNKEIITSHGGEPLGELPSGSAGASKSEIGRKGLEKACQEYLLYIPPNSIGRKVLYNVLELVNTINTGKDTTIYEGACKKCANFNMETIDVEYLMELTKVEIKQTRNILQKRLVDNISININDTIRIGEKAKNTILGSGENTTNQVNDENEDADEDAPLLGGSNLESRLQELNGQAKKLTEFTNQICSQEILTNIYQFGDKAWNDQWNEQWDKAMYKTWREFWKSLFSMGNQALKEMHSFQEERDIMKNRYTEQKTKAEGILCKIDKDQFKGKEVNQAAKQLKTSYDRFQELNDLVGQALEKVPFTPGFKSFSGRFDRVLDPSQKGFEISTRLIINEWLNELESVVNELSQGVKAPSKKASES